MIQKSRFTIEELNALAQSAPPAENRTSPHSSPSSPIPLRAHPESPKPGTKPKSNIETDHGARREIADNLFQEIFTADIDWQSETKGFCPCPNQDSHTGHSKSECAIWINGDFGANGWPTLKCAHGGCQDNQAIKHFNHEMRSRIAKAERGGSDHNPNDYLKGLYPGVADVCGEPFSYCLKPGAKGGADLWTPVDLNESFFASILTPSANKYDPAVFDSDENKWFRYNPSRGYYSSVKPEDLHAPIDQVLFKTANECSEASINKTPLLFAFRRTKILAPIITKASGFCAVASEFWERPEMKLPVNNGVLDLVTRTLSPHSPDFHFRGVLPVNYAPDAECPDWLAFLNGAQSPENVDLIQRILAQVILGKNQAQVLTIFTGEAGSGKGTIIRVMTDVVGSQNVGTLRTHQLDGRFEMARHRHKLLLYGADVSEDFLTNAGAAMIKAMTGEDPISPEFKGSNATPPAEPLTCSIIVTANSRLRLRLVGDKDAWQRRLIFIPFGNAVPESVRKNGLSEHLVKKEGPGILNWMLEGVKKLLADKGRIRLTEEQKRVRDTLLEESESYVAFAREVVVKDDFECLTAEDAYAGYVTFCNAKQWAPITPKAFGKGFNQAVVDLHGITPSHDLMRRNGMHGRGWRGLRLNEHSTHREYEVLD